jgi:hypothetical protein
MRLCEVQSIFCNIIKMDFMHRSDVTPDGLLLLEES